MRYLLIKILIFNILISTPSIANTLSDEQANVGVKIFQSVCFINAFQPEKIKEIANQKFTKFPDDKKQIWLKFTKSKTGDAWAAIFPNKGHFIIVLSDAGNCHLIAKNLNKDRAHEKIKDLGKQAENNFSNVEVKFNKTKSDQTIKSSGFELFYNESNTPNIVVVLSTPLSDSDKTRPAALMTVATASY